MLECIPTISQESIEAFAEKEINEVATKVVELLDELSHSNPVLARAIRVSSEVVSENATDDPELRQDIECNTTVAILVVLRLIDRAIQSVELEAKLTERR